MAAGEAIGCFGLTEPDVGSDPASMRTTARLDGDEWVLNGTKMWITNGGVADLAVVWARTDDGVRGFIVPRESPGFTTRDIERKLSLRASVTSELVFDDCRIPASGAGLAGEGQQRAGGAGHRARVPDHPRGQRDHARVPGHPPHEQPRVGADLRGHERGPPADPGQGRHRPRRVQLAPG